MTVLAVQDINDHGLAPVYTAVTATDDVPADNVFVHVKNGNVADTVVTIVTPGSEDGDLAVADRTVTVPAGTDKFIGPFAGRSFKNPTTGLVRLQYSVTATVTAAALRV